MMLHTEYQGSVVSDKMCSWFPYISLSRTCDPYSEAIFWPQGNNSNKLGRGPSGDAKHTKCQGSRTCDFRQEDFFTFSLYKPVSNM